MISQFSRSSRILIIALSNLGDAILTYPAIQALFAAEPGGEFHMLASPRTRELFLGDPRIARVWVSEKRASVLHHAWLIVRLFLSWFDLVVDFRHSIIPLFLVGSRRSPLLRRKATAAHQAEQHLALVKALGISTPAQFQPLPYGPEDEQWAGGIASAGPTVVMAPGARSHLKRWGAERFAQVADRLIEEEKVQIVLVGDAQEKTISQEVVSQMRQRPIDVTGRTTLRQLFALLSASQLLITNDSACLHAAEAMGLPTVAIFGPTDEKKYGPRNPRSRVVRLHLVCAPCERALCPYDHECMKWLGVDEVHEAAVTILRSLDHDAGRPALGPSAQCGSSHAGHPRVITNLKVG